MAQAFDVDADEVLGRSRTWPLVFARQTAYWLINKGMGYSYSKTGRMFSRHHQGIMHGVGKVIDVLELADVNKNDNGSWANQIKASHKNLIRFYLVYTEVKQEEVKDVVEVA